MKNARLTMIMSLAVVVMWLAGSGTNTSDNPGVVVAPGVTRLSLNVPSTHQPTSVTAHRNNNSGSSAKRDPTSTTVSGRVVNRATSKPVAGIIIEFKNLHGGNVHTMTNRRGEYAVKLPPDVYTALALDPDPESDVIYQVVGGDNSVSVPPSTRVDFVSS
jgi:hypothetical protein